MGSVVSQDKLGTFLASVTPQGTDTSNPVFISTGESCEVPSMILLINSESHKSLEGHMRRIHMRHRWGLPFKVLTPINPLKVKNTLASPFLCPIVPSVHLLLQVLVCRRGQFTSQPHFSFRIPVLEEDVQTGVPKLPIMMGTLIPPQSTQ